MLDASQMAFFVFVDGCDSLMRYIRHLLLSVILLLYYQLINTYFNLF
jgi:hypothetical protein